MPLPRSAAIANEGSDEVGQPIPADGLVTRENTPDFSLHPGNTPVRHLPGAFYHVVNSSFGAFATSMRFVELTRRAPTSVLAL